MREAFIAWVGPDADEQAVERVLVAANRNYDCTVKVLAATPSAAAPAGATPAAETPATPAAPAAAASASTAVFGKIVLDSYAKNCRDPEIGSGILAVGGYDLTLLHEAAQQLAGGRYDPHDRDADQRVVRNAFVDFDTDAFTLLAKRMPFSAAFYDIERGRLVAVRAARTAGSSDAAQDYAYLFYGDTPGGGRVFSNDESLLSAFCAEAVPMDPNTYYDSAPDSFITFALPPTHAADDMGIRSNYANARDIIALVNGIVAQAADTTLADTMDAAFAAYFAGHDPVQRVSAFVDATIDQVAADRINRAVADKVAALDIDHAVEQTFDARCRELLESYLAHNAAPQVNVVNLGGVELARTSCAYYHEKYEQVLAQVQLDEPVMLVGPAGSGKNFAVSQIAEGLGLPMYYTNNASNEFKLTGFIDAGGTYRDTGFYKAFKTGGVFFLDEIDNSDPAALIVINSALANGYMAFPHETIERHPDFRCVAAANTWGKGSNLLYVGRNVLDGATLDRFDMVFFDYDRRLERALYPSDNLLAFLWSFRDAVDACRIPHIVSTRAIGKCYKKELAGLDVETILRTNVIRSLSQDDLNVIIGAMRGDGASERNPYYACITTVRIDK